ESSRSDAALLSKHCQVLLQRLRHLGGIVCVHRLLYVADRRLKIAAFSTGHRSVSIESASRHCVMLQAFFASLIACCGFLNEGFGHVARNHARWLKAIA